MLFAHVNNINVIYLLNSFRLCLDWWIWAIDFKSKITNLLMLFGLVHFTMESKFFNFYFVLVLKEFWCIWNLYNMKSFEIYSSDLLLKLNFFFQMQPQGIFSQVFSSFCDMDEGLYFNGHMSWENLLVQSQIWNLNL